VIGQIKGTVVSQHPPTIVVDVQGVGYELNAPLPVIFQLPPPPEKVLFYTHLVVREDAQVLYGFLSSIDRDWFRELIKVSGIGPRIGLAILSAMSAQNLCEYIIDQQSSVLQKVPGVGKKTAERLVIELQEKCRKWLSTQQAGAAHLAKGESGHCVSDERVEQRQIEQDAHDALLALGYKPSAATQVIRRVISPGCTSEQLIKRALQEMVQA